MILFEIRKFKYYASDFFNPDEFVEIPETLFDSTVVKYRSLFDMHYLDGSTRIFINKKNPLDRYKVVTVC